MRYLSSSSAQIIFLFASLFFANQAWAQVAIGTNGTPSPDPNAVLLLEGNGTTQGLVIPIISNIATAPNKVGMIAYSAGKIYYNDGSQWTTVGGGGGSSLININGNTITVGSGATSINLAQGFSNSANGFLYWNGTAWQQAQFTLPTSTQALVYNPATSAWQFQSLGAAIVADGSITGGAAGTGVKIAVNTITDANVSASAAIAGSKIDPTFTVGVTAPSLKLTGGGTSINGQAYTWPAVAPLANTFLKSDATGNLSWASSGGGGFSTLNAIPKGDGSTLVASTITDDGTTVEVTAVSPTLKLRSTSNVSTTAASSLDFVNAINGTIGSISDTGSSDHLQISSFSQGLLFNTNFSTRMAIDNNGNVGIGTVSPISKLDVSGDLHLSQITAPSPTTDKLYNLGGNLFWNGTNISSGGGGGWSLTGNAGTNPATNFIGTTDAQPLIIRNSGVESMRINTSYVSMGGRTTPVNVNSFFDLQTDNGSGLGGMYVDVADPDGDAFYGYSNLGTSRALTYMDATTGSWFVQTAGSDRLSITSGGNVGIGSDSPLNTLHVQSTLTGTDITTVPVARFANNTLNGNTKVILGSDNTTADGFSNFASGSTTATQILGFGVGNAISTTAQLNITGSGQVGINTTTPDSDATLHVLGFSSKIRAEGFAATLSLVANPFFSGSTHDFSIASSSAGTLTFTDNGATRMQITSAGGVSINGALSKGSGTFKIDHPQDPENKYLYHSFVESPDMMNVYNGNITTDAQGDAVVSLPTYFEALNKDFRYQLTVIGTFAQAIVMKEVEANQFIIKTDKPNVKVSWQVTGVRKDPFAEKNRVVPEVEKTGSEKGKFLHPEAYGLPLDRSINYEPKNENN